MHINFAELTRDEKNKITYSPTTYALYKRNGKMNACPVVIVGRYYFYMNERMAKQKKQHEILAIVHESTLESFLTGEIEGMEVFNDMYTESFHHELLLLLGNIMSADYIYVESDREELLNNYKKDLYNFLLTLIDVCSEEVHPYRLTNTIFTYISELLYRMNVTEYVDMVASILSDALDTLEEEDGTNTDDDFMIRDDNADTTTKADDGKTDFDDFLRGLVI